MSAAEQTAARIARARVAAGADPWQLHAGCAEQPELVTTTRAPEIFAGLHLCAGCPVTAQCTQWAQDEPEYHGIRGGVVPARSVRRAG